MYINIKTVSVLLLFFFSKILSAQLNCEKFKVGTFNNIENGIVKSIIYRNDSIQVERYGEKEIKLKIEWKDSCTYQLTFLEGNQAWLNSRSKDQPAPLDLIVTIIAVKKNYCTQKAKFIGSDDFVYTSVVKKINGKCHKITDIKTNKTPH